MPDVTLRATFIDGSTIRNTGWIDIESWESQDLKATLNFTPRDNKWEVLVGSMPDTSGTMKGVSINGVAYRVMGDGNVTLAAAYKNEGVATSGVMLRRMTKQARTLSGITLACNLQEYETLRTYTETP